MSRLSVVDEIFLRTHRGYGTPIALQGLWRSNERVDRSALEHIHGRLRHGALGRRVVRSRILGARPRWEPSAACYPLDYRVQPLASRDISSWAEAGLPELDPTRAPGWHVRASALDNGGTIIALTCSHALTDARGLINATAQAFATEPESPGCERDSDIADALATWRTILTGTRPTIPRPISGKPSTHPKRLPARCAIVSCPAAAWDSAARSGDGSSNSLFVATVVNVLAAATGDRSPVSVALPIDTRTTESVGNAMAVSATVIRPDDSLATVRDRCGDAYNSPMGNPRGLPPEWLHVLPDRVAHAASTGAGERDVLCSNIGTLPDALARLGSHPAAGIATRAIHPGIDATHLAALRTRLAGYLSRLRDEYTLSLVTFDGAIESDERLSDLVVAELARRNVTARTW